MSTPIAVHRQDPGQPPAGSKPGGGLGALGKNKGVLLAAGGAGLVVLLALMRSSGSSDQSGDTLQTSGTGSTYDSTSTDLYNSIQPEIDALEAQLNNLQNSQPTPGSPVTSNPITSTPKPVTTTTGGSSKPKPAPPKTTTPKPKTTTKTITVKKGDTLSAIAKRYGISMATLKKLNPVYWTNAKYHNGNLIWAGDKVKV